MTLTVAAAAYRQALDALHRAEHARAVAHAAHLDTVPLLGRVRVGAGSDATRKAHYSACTTTAEAARAVEHARGLLVDAALAATVDNTRCRP